MLTDWTKILSVCLQRVAAHCDRKLCHLKNFRPRYNPLSSHVANCRVANCPNPYNKCVPNDHASALYVQPEAYATSAPRQTTAQT